MTTKRLDLKKLLGFKLLKSLPKAQQAQAVRVKLGAKIGMIK
jgi:hypothetical protein